MGEHEIDRRNLHALIAEGRATNCFLPARSRSTRHGWEHRLPALQGRAPSSGRPTGRGRRREQRERGVRSPLQAAAEHVSADRLRFSRCVCIQEKIDAIEQANLKPIGRAPVDKESSFVFQRWRIVKVVHSQVSNFVAALAHLNLPTSEIRIHEQRGARANQGSSRCR
jgi:hypothetical protein